MIVAPNHLKAALTSPKCQRPQVIYAANFYCTWYKANANTLVREADREDSIRQTDTELTSPTSLPKETGVFDSRFHGLLAPVFSCFKDDE